LWNKQDVEDRTDHFVAVQDIALAVRIPHRLFQFTSRSKLTVPFSGSTNHGLRIASDASLPISSAGIDEVKHLSIVFIHIVFLPAANI
jgi:hypothetical protein